MGAKNGSRASAEAVRAEIRAPAGREDCRRSAVDDAAHVPRNARAHAARVPRARHSGPARRGRARGERREAPRSSQSRISTRSSGSGAAASSRPHRDAGATRSPRTTPRRPPRRTRSSASSPRTARAASQGAADERARRCARADRRARGRPRRRRGPARRRARRRAPRRGRRAPGVHGVYTVEIGTRARARHLARELGCRRIAERLARDVVPRGEVLLLVVQREERGPDVVPTAHLATMRAALAVNALGGAA